ncbi:MAG: VOC family protein [Actinomycetota bacterium]
MEDSILRVIDHVVLGVQDLDVAGDRLLSEHGLASVAGGRHANWGTANRIVPLGADYLELIAVVDPEQAAGTALGREMTELTVDGDRWFSICLASDDVNPIAARLALPVDPGARTRPDGTEVRWRGAGVDAPTRPRWLPFFITWESARELHPGRTPIQHPSGANGIDWVEVGGDPERLSVWLGGADLPIRVVDDEPEVHRVVLSTADGAGLVL